MGCRESRKSQDDLNTNKLELKTFQKQITKFSVSIKLSFIFLLCSSTVLILSNSVYKNKLLLVTHSSFLQTLIFWHFSQLQDPSHIFSTNTKQSDSNRIRNHNHLVRERKVRLNGWVFNYELSGCGFESSWCHLNSRYSTCFEKGFFWHSDKL